MQVTSASAVTRYQNQAAVIQSGGNLLSTKISPRYVRWTERQGEVGGSTSGSLHGPRQSHQTHRSDRIHQVCSYSHV